LIPALSALYQDQNLQRLRFTYPNKLLFLCGGASPLNPTTTTKASNLRDYIYRIKKLQRRLKADVILAETATTLYRDSHYNDLISFEEDIARIASIVLVIPESAGSLAELGAFATNDNFRHALRVVVQDKYENDESFIRFGPIKRIINHHRDFVGFYTWKLNNAQNVVISSPNYKEVFNFINGHLDRIPDSISFPTDADTQLFCIVYWVIYVLNVVSESLLLRCIETLVPDVTSENILNKIYCLLRIARWIAKISTDTDYYHTTMDTDPFGYSYKADAKERDTVRRKADIAQEMTAVEKTPAPVFSRAMAGRKGRVK
jgi:hypothetical protein